MFQDEVPKGLPLVRGIEHKIDFISGDVIPNRPDNRANQLILKKFRGK